MTLEGSLVCRLYLECKLKRSVGDAIQVLLDELVCKLGTLPLLPLPAGGLGRGIPLGLAGPLGAVQGALQRGDLLSSLVFLLSVGGGGGSVVQRLMDQMRLAWPENLHDKRHTIYISKNVLLAFFLYCTFAYYGHRKYGVIHRNMTVILLF